MTQQASSVPVYVVGGFLGSGKSTLLGRLLAHEISLGSRPGVVMNEMGSIDVDGRMLHDCAGGEMDMHTLLGGCICCDLSDELTGSVRRLLDETEASKIFVETTGIADVGQVVDGVRRALVPANGGRRGTLAGVFLVVDTSRFVELEATLGPEAVRLRDVSSVVLNKLDLAVPGAADGLATRFGTMRPGVRVYRSVRGDVPAAALLESAPPSLLSAAPSGNGEAVVDTTRGFSSVSCRIELPVDVEALERLLGRYNSVFRAKGLVQPMGREGFHELQWVPRRLDLQAYPATPPETGELVVIGRRVPWDRFFRGLEACLVRPGRAASPRQHSRRNGA